MSNSASTWKSCLRITANWQQLRALQAKRLRPSSRRRPRPTPALGGGGVDHEYVERRLKETSHDIASAQELWRRELQTPAYIEETLRNLVYNLQGFETETHRHNQDRARKMQLITGCWSQNPAMENQANNRAHELQEEQRRALQEQEARMRAQKEAGLKQRAELEALRGEIEQKGADSDDTETQRRMEELNKREHELEKQLKQQQLEAEERARQLEEQMRRDKEENMKLLQEASKERAKGQQRLLLARRAHRRHQPPGHGNP